MPIYSLDEVAPRLPAVGRYWIAPSADVIGNVWLKTEASIWFNAVLRGDNELITVGQGSNIQDGTVCHTDRGAPLSIGDYCTVGHSAILHGCTIGDGSLIGMGATVLNHAIVGKNCLVGAHTLITEGKIIPDNSLVVGAPGKVAKILSAEQIVGLRQSADHYIENWKRFSGSLIVS